MKRVEDERSNTCKLFGKMEIFSKNTRNYLKSFARNMLIFNNYTKQVYLFCVLVSSILIFSLTKRIKKVALLMLLLIGVIHSESFGQSSQNQDRRHASPSVLIGNTITIIPDFIIYFRLDKSDIDPSYMNNAAVLDHMSRVVTEQNLAYIDSLIISAYASPEAPSTYNKRLSERRANAVRDYFLKKFPLLKPDIVHAYGQGENWDGLRELVTADSLLPQRSEVLRIIDSDLSEDAREQRLKALQGGVVYRYIYKNFYPRLRLGASLNVMLAEAAPEGLRSLISGPTIEPLAPCAPLETLLPPATITPT